MEYITEKTINILLKSTFSTITSFKYQHVYCKKCSCFFYPPGKFQDGALEGLKPFSGGIHLVPQQTPTERCTQKQQGNLLIFFNRSRFHFPPVAFPSRSVSGKCWCCFRRSPPTSAFCLQPQTRAFVFRTNPVANNWEQELCYCGPLGGRSTQRGLMFAVTVTNADQRKWVLGILVMKNKCIWPNPAIMLQWSSFSNYCVVFRYRCLINAKL